MHRCIQFIITSPWHTCMQCNELINTTENRGLVWPDSEPFYHYLFPPLIHTHIFMHFKYCLRSEKNCLIFLKIRMRFLSNILMLEKMDKKSTLIFTNALTVEYLNRNYIYFVSKWEINFQPLVELVKRRPAESAIGRVGKATACGVSHW